MFALEIWKKDHQIQIPVESAKPDWFSDLKRGHAWVRSSAGSKCDLFVPWDTDHLQKMRPSGKRNNLSTTQPWWPQQEQSRIAETELCLQTAEAICQQEPYITMVAQCSFQPSSVIACSRIQEDIQWCSNINIYSSSTSSWVSAIRTLNPWAFISFNLRVIVHYSFVFSPVKPFVNDMIEFDKFCWLQSLIPYLIDNQRYP